jgi:hypothetical protein
MNRLSELQTIVKISKICNNNGLTKEADQLLNIFTKLAQEITDLPKEESVILNTMEPNIAEPAIDQTLVDKINDFIDSSETLQKNLIENKSMEETKKLLPEITRLIDLARTILSNSKTDEHNKKMLNIALPNLLGIQDALK